MELEFIAGLLAGKAACRYPHVHAISKPAATCLYRIILYIKMACQCISDRPFYFDFFNQIPSWI